MESKIIEMFKDPSVGLLGVDALHRKLNDSGVKVTKAEIKKTLASLESSSLNKPVKIRGKTRKTIAKYPHQQWQADLVEMDVPAGAPASENNGTRYLLTVIDVFSRYAFVRPLKQKTGEEITKAFRSIFDEGEYPTKIQTDQGSEFYNNTFQDFLKKHDVTLFSTFGDGKATMVERFNRTLKSMMSRLIDVNQSFRYIDHLQDMVRNYNNTYHGTIKMKPREALEKENLLDVYENIIGADEEPDKPNLKKGMYVRIPRYKTQFSKEMIGNYTIEVFIIDRVRKTNPPTYHIKDQMGENILGSYYERELQEVPQESALERRIEKVMLKKKEKGVNMVFVKWLGYGDKFNDWIPEKDLKNL